MDTAQQSTIHALARRAAAWAARGVPRGHRKDAFSEAFGKVVIASEGETWESPVHRRRWAFVVAENAVRDYCAEMRVGKIDSEVLPDAIADSGPDPASAAESAEKAIIWRDRRNALAKQIRRLPNGLRGIAWARYGKGRTIKQVAEDFGYSETPCANRLALAESRLRAGLGGERSCAEARKRLSLREREVLSWVAAAKTNAEIGAILGLAPRSVGNHLKRIFAKLQVYNRVAAVLVYLQTSDKNL